MFVLCLFCMFVFDNRDPLSTRTINMPESDEEDLKI